MNITCIIQFFNVLNLIYQRLTMSWHHSTHFNSVGALGHVLIVSHSYQTSFGFPGSDLNLDCGLHDHVITRFASVGIRARLENKVISFCYFHFF
jgi:hypothetical protein